MEKVMSADGTVIAFDQLGQGPPIILVAGASCARAVGVPIAEALTPHMTVLNYDRRGRGDSSDTHPYAVAREVEDIQVLIDAAGGAASLLGLSSGAVLAAEAAAHGLPVESLIMWEPPFSIDAEAAQRSRAYARRLSELLDGGRRDEALTLFMRQVGMPEEMIEGARRSPYWEAGVRLAPTLAYDAAIMGDGTIPSGRFARIEAATLVLAGSQSPEFMRVAAARAAAAIPGAGHDILDGQDHNVAADVIASVVVARFADRRP
ncbi:alpha/beta fold hydrolase [Phytoactinopolyspora halotolerans]|uniref:Alpha/beta hydrolase n=1 Tax=Phytoactinopolyspora halotolerans TaxID=1981512 RepID=A0A6L9S6Y8_9ACTN|nr:alpha/beta hydrolase [Phytoactinopolyspora halotolerans]NEE00424.1 alpha/beta hydrolase [Phytoactinopolyspora halotolerans]